MAHAAQYCVHGHGRAIAQHARAHAAPLEGLNNAKGLNFSPRRITVSTCGIEKGLRELGDSGLAYLAVSLHAPTQELRAKIMPKAARWPLDEMFEALKSYPP